MFRPVQWLRTAKKAVYSRLQSHPAAYARLRSAFSRHRLPPGDLVELDVIERSDRDALRKRAALLGPVFKGIAWNELCICIIGIDRCRQFTQAHRNSVRVQTMELEHLIPNGFLCAMEGETHRDTRKSTARALRSTTSCPHASKQNNAILESIAVEGLRNYTDQASQHRNSADAYTTAMSEIATSSLIWIYFGAAPGTPEHARFASHLQKLGPYGLVWNPQKRQEVAFRDFRDDLQAEANDLRNGAQRLSPLGLLARMVQDGTLSESMLGNLIYQAEMARSDMKNFFRWLTRHATDEPTALDEIAVEQPVDPSQTSLLESFVLETLRTDQSERLMRRVECDIVFDRFLIPQHATVRLCLWESHHGADTFSNPHRFDPRRFAEKVPGNDVFAPFGVDHHQCPMGDVVVNLGMIFLRALAQGYRVKAISPGPPVRGAYHWEPAPGFAVELTKRE